jgi:hypothetical protein
MIAGARLFAPFLFFAGSGRKRAARFYEMSGMARERLLAEVMPSTSAANRAG